MEDMPRYKISNNLETFNVLLGLMDEEREICQAADDCLKIVATNQQILMDLLRLDSSNDDSKKFEWSRILDSSNSKVTLYTMQLIEQILLDDQSREDFENYEIARLKRSWVSRFLKAGGLDQIISMMNEMLVELQQDSLVKSVVEEAELSRKKKLLAMTLKVINVIVHVTITAVKNDPHG